MPTVKISIRAKTFYEMYAYAAYAHHLQPDSEIAGWAHYNKEDGIYKLAPLLDQEAHSTEVITDTSAFLDKKYNMSDMLVQWHSHCNMGCSPSGEGGDLGNIKKLGKLMPMVITVIVNLKMQYHAQVDIFKIKELELSEPITSSVELVPYYEEDRICKDVKKHLKEKKIVVEVKKDTPAYSIPQRYYGNADAYYDRHYWDKKWGKEEDMFSDYIPPKREVITTTVPVVNQKQLASFNTSKGWMMNIIRKAPNFPKDFKMLTFKDGLYIQHMPTGTYLTHTLVHGTQVSGLPSTFIDFCKKINVTLKDALIEQKGK